MNIDGYLSWYRLLWGCIPDTSLQIVVQQLPEEAEFLRVSVKAKVVSADKIVTVTGDLKKQDVILADGTGTGRLTLWQDKTDTVSEGVCYAFTWLYVNTRRTSTCVWEKVVRFLRE